MHYHHLYFPEVKTKIQKRCDLLTVIYQMVVLAFHLGLPDNHRIATPLISPGGQDLLYSQVAQHFPICYFHCLYNYLSNICFSIRLWCARAQKGCPSCFTPVPSGQWHACYKLKYLPCFQILELHHSICKRVIGLFRYKYQLSISNHL